MDLPKFDRPRSLVEETFEAGNRLVFYELPHFRRYPDAMATPVGPLDPILFALAFVLLAYASVILVSASPQRFQAHALNLGVAIVCLVLAAHTPPQRLKAMAPWLYLLGIVLL